MTIAGHMRTLIELALEAVEREHRVRIVLAVESGSRAWGFPSPDSDYDVRFVYAGPLERYLTLYPARDTIEFSDGDLDVAGWDVGKALRLLAKANPALLEWLCSPIVYRWTDDAERLRALALHSPYRRSAHHHYGSLARNNFDRYIADRPSVNLKKYMYCLRPALALNWLRTRDDPPPMDMASLLSGLVLRADLGEAIEAIVAAKRLTVELGEGPPIPVIDAFVRDELAEAGDQPEHAGDYDGGFAADADRLFRDMVLRPARP